MSRQFSSLKTRFFCAFHKLLLVFFTQSFEKGSYVSVKIPSSHLLRFLLLLFIVWAFVCPMAGLFAFKAPSFFHQLRSLIKGQSVDVHSVRVSLLSWKEESLSRIFVLRLGGHISTGSFVCSVDLLVLMIDFHRPLVPIVEVGKRGFEFHKPILEGFRQGFLEQFDRKSTVRVNFRFSCQKFESGNVFVD